MALHGLTEGLVRLAVAHGGLWRLRAALALAILGSASWARGVSLPQRAVLGG